MQDIHLIKNKKKEIKTPQISYKHFVFKVGTTEEILIVF